MTPPLPDTTELGLDPEAERVDQLAREVLGDNYLHFHMSRLELVEDLVEERVTVRAQLTRSGSGERIEVEGTGVGLVDAFFDGIMKAFSDEHPSLKTISIADFSVRSGFDGARGRRSDAQAVATLRVLNSEGTEFEFKRATPSVTRSSIRAALDALTFFINSERAFIQLHLALKDAKERRRSDLVERFQTQMGTLVSATSYSEVIERIKQESDG